MSKMTCNVLPVVLPLLLGVTAIAQAADCTPTTDAAVIRQAEQKRFVLTKAITRKRSRRSSRHAVTRRRRAWFWTRDAAPRQCRSRRRG